MIEHTYCPACGAKHSRNASFCTKCGNRLESDPFAELPNPLGASSTAWIDDFSDTAIPARNNGLLLGFRVVTAASPLIGVLQFSDDMYAGTRIAQIWLVSVLLPALLVLVPLLEGRRVFGIQGRDARLVLMGAVSAFFVAIRATGSLIDNTFVDAPMFVLSQVLGLCGFVVVGLSIPWKKNLSSWFVETVNPIHPVLAIGAASLFFLLRSGDNYQFFFSPGSISGPSVLEFLFLAVLVATGFLRSPWRHFVAIPIGLFSILSYVANVLFVDATVAPWPNPVTFACCVALCFPLDDASDEQLTSFQ